MYNVCHDRKNDLYCIACCSFEKIDPNSTEQRSKLKKEVEENTTFFKNKKIKSKIQLGIHRYYASREDKNSLVCGNVVYLDENKKAVGCAIHPNIVGDDQRPCHILAFCNEYFKINESKEKIDEHIKSNKNCNWIKYSARLREKVDVWSLLAGYIKSKI